jgi:hypothetical protein
VKRRKLIECTIDQAFDDGGDPLDNLIVAALDNRKLSQAIGSPLRQECAKLIREVIDRALKHVETGEPDRPTERLTLIVPAPKGRHRRVKVPKIEQRPKTIRVIRNPGN